MKKSDKLKKIHPGEILKHEVIKANNLTIKKASKLLNVTRLTLSNILNCKSSITTNMALRISYVFGGSPYFWLRLQMKYDMYISEKTFTTEGLKKIQNLT